MKPIRHTWNTLKNIASGIKNFNVPLHELPNVKDQASIPQLLHDCVGFLRRSGNY